MPAAAGAAVPDAYTHNAALSSDLIALRAEVDRAKAIAHKASSTWDTMRKERDFHRMHHKRVAQVRARTTVEARAAPEVGQFIRNTATRAHWCQPSSACTPRREQEKNKLIKDIKLLKAHYEKYEPAIQVLRKKYETLIREKSLMGRERDALRRRLDEVLADQGSQIKASRGALRGAWTRAAARTAETHALTGTGKSLLQVTSTRVRPSTKHRCRRRRSRRGTLPVGGVHRQDRQPLAQRQACRCSRGPIPLQIAPSNRSPLALCGLKRYSRATSLASHSWRCILANRSSCGTACLDARSHGARPAIALSLQRLAVNESSWSRL